MTQKTMKSEADWKCEAKELFEKDRRDGYEIVLVVLSLNKTHTRYPRYQSGEASFSASLTTHPFTLGNCDAVEMRVYAGSFVHLANADLSSAVKDGAEKEN
ncbi:unnamed protein product [Enterobius vermicularis]|uniref:DUF3467 domain-containing protein n=1 Tax=Enterobius vermicularis TaxID=51028 RepID=A0A0N4UTG8_ENTVE|nr:unnamed protein product [Enterobius vermicularis]